MAEITAEHWSGAIRLAIKQEHLYAKIDELDFLLEPNVEDVVEPMDTVEPVPMEIDQVPFQEPVQAPIQESLKVYKCDHCDYKTNFKMHLKNHEKSYKECEVCAKVFCGKRVTRDLEKHKKEHDYYPKGAHVCSVCNKPFQYESYLKRHLRRSGCGKK